MVIPIVVDTFELVPEGLEKRLRGKMKIRGRFKIVLTTTLLRSARIFRRVLEIIGDLLPLDKTGVQNTRRVIIIIIINYLVFCNKNRSHNS